MSYLAAPKHIYPVGDSNGRGGLYVVGEYDGGYFRVHAKRGGRPISGRLDWAGLRAWLAENGRICPDVV